MPRIVFGVCGASGMPLAQAVLAAFAAVPDLEVHLVLTHAARQVIAAECGGASALERYAARVYAPDDFAAGPSSGSWQHDGMIVCPCSASSLAAIAQGAGRHLVHRAADVTLKERRPLVLALRETPLSRLHLHNMLAASAAGAVIMPFMPAFYLRDANLGGMMRHFAGRLLDQLHLAHDLGERWQGDAC